MSARPFALTLAAMTVAAGVGAAFASPASAADVPRGRVTASTGVVARSLPTPTSDRLGRYATGTVIELVCTIRSSTVDGNDRWYLVRTDGPTRWVTARYVSPVGAAPRYCDGEEASVAARTTATLTVRAAPTTASTAVGRLPKGTEVRVICFVVGPRVDGNAAWYHTSDHRWLASRYLTLSEHTPGNCG